MIISSEIFRYTARCIIIETNVAKFSLRSQERRKAGQGLQAAALTSVEQVPVLIDLGLGGEMTTVVEVFQQITSF